MANLNKKQKVRFEGGGLVLFDEVQQAMTGERVLKSAGYMVKLVAPPPELRRGCDLAVEISLVEQPGIQRVLDENDVFYISIDPIRIKTAPLLDVVKVTDFGDWVMVKAGNMKMTYEKNSGVIVNVSGGGCPDIPYLHAELIDKRIEEAQRPKDLGFTLCAVNLDRAFDECIDLRSGGDRK
ncbi:MAG: DUF3343 domain-containing protein [Dehalococcoidia bacterium]